MRFLHFSSKTVIVSRMTAGGNNTMILATVTSIRGHIQPLDAERTRLIDGVYGKSYRIWVDTGVSLEDGDRLKDDDGNFYKIRKGGITARAEGSIDYQEVLIEKVS